MKNIKYSLPIKTVSFILAILLFISTAFCAVSSVVIVCLTAEMGSMEDAREVLIKDYLYSFTDDVALSYCEAQSEEEVLKRYENSNFYLTLSDGKSGKPLASNYSGEQSSVKVSSTHSFEHFHTVDINGNVTWEYSAEQENCTYNVSLYIKDELPRNDGFPFIAGVVDFVTNHQSLMFISTVLGLILLIILLVFMYSIAGRKGPNGDLHLMFIDEIPFDIFTAFFVLIIAFGIIFVMDLYSDVLVIIGICLLTVAIFVLYLIYSMSVAVRIKTHTLFKNTLIFKIFAWIFKQSKKLLKKAKYIFKNIPLVLKTAGCLAGLAFINLLAVILSENLGLLILWFIECIVIIPAVILIAIGIKKLKSGADKITEGDLESKINTSALLGELKDFGETLNNISDGMSISVDEKMKSERFKTELITNVSHDIKTPITSIINYVDLMKKEETENENIEKYIDVLDRQSKRLKRLTEDLIEASKASTGNISVNLGRCSLGVLLTQAAGEYEERFKKAGLELVLKTPENTVDISADGRHLWRIFDNLMSNILKYSQTGTRVYISIEKKDKKAFVIFKNISKFELNISSDELMERFVRGDRSRHTEGNGLGLSIARSLTELQNGSMNLNVDGDLFKVTLVFDEFK